MGLWDLYLLRLGFRLNSLVLFILFCLNLLKDCYCLSPPHDHLLHLSDLKNIKMTPNFSAQDIALCFQVLPVSVLLTCSVVHLTSLSWAESLVLGAVAISGSKWVATSYNTFFFFFPLSSSSQEMWDRIKKVKIIGSKKSERTAEMSSFLQVTIEFE